MLRTIRCSCAGASQTLIAACSILFEEGEFKEVQSNPRLSKFGSAPSASNSWRLGATSQSHLPTNSFADIDCDDCHNTSRHLPHAFIFVSHRLPQEIPKPSANFESRQAPQCRESTSSPQGGRRLRSAVSSTSEKDDMRENLQLSSRSLITDGYETLPMAQRQSSTNMS
jgi:hypothetical protein